MGFVAAIPLGPINIYVVSNTLKRDFFHGAMGGVTAAVLDIVFCLFFLLGIVRVVDIIQRYALILKILAALLLTAIGIRLVLQSRAFTEESWPERPTKISARPAVAVFLLYISNPALYGFWLGAASMATTHGWVKSTSEAWLFSLAVGLGSVLWYLLLVSYVSRHHHQIRPRTFRKILIGLAVILLLFGGYTFLSVFVPSLTGSH